MRCDDVRGMLADRLDDLLEPDSAVAVSEHVEGCSACREAERHAASVRKALYRPWAVAHPSAALPAIVARGRRRSGTRFMLTLLRYAAVFTAGVLVARQVASPTATDAIPTTTPAAITAPALSAPLTDYPRRIR